MYKELSTRIYFWYQTDTIMDRLKMYTQTLTKYLPEDNTHITDDELDLVIIEAEKAINYIFNVAYKLSKTIQNSQMINTPFALEGVNYGNVFGFKLINYHGQNDNIVQVVDSNIEKYLISLIAEKWFILTGKADLAKLEQQNQVNLFISYNNSLTELYKPRIDDVTPVFTVADAEVDDDTGELIEDTTTTTTEMTDPVYYDTFTDFPETGVSNITYVDSSAGAQYYWNGTQYLPFSGSNRTFSVEFEDVNEVVVTHNLNKLMPNVSMTDTDGNDWEVDYEPTDENSGVVRWENNKSGTLYLS